MTKSNKKLKIQRVNNPSDLSRVAKLFDATRQVIEDFSLFIKQCYRIIVWSIEKIHKVKIQKLQKQKIEG